MANTSFQIGDATDRALTQTLAHEFLLAKEAFDRFLRMANVTTVLRGGSTKTRLSVYSAYAASLHHLYEFYVGCIKRQRRSTSQILWQELDPIFDAEAIKLLRNRAERIERGDAAPWDNHISHYQVPPAPGFGRAFRQVRNVTAHADLTRSTSQKISLHSFFREYHRIIWLMFEAAAFTWTVEDLGAHKWGEIENFAMEIGLFKKHDKHAPSTPK